MLWSERIETGVFEERDALEGSSRDQAYRGAIVSER